MEIQTDLIFNEMTSHLYHCPVYALDKTAVLGQTHVLLAICVKQAGHDLHEELNELEPYTVRTALLPSNDAWIFKHIAFVEGLVHKLSFNTPSYNCVDNWIRAHITNILHVFATINPLKALLLSWLCNSFYHGKISNYVLNSVTSIQLNTRLFDPFEASNKIKQA